MREIKESGDTITREDESTGTTTDPFDGDSDPEASAHIVDQHANDIPVDVAISKGMTVVAMCGYRWVPKMNHAFEKPMCKACQRALAALP
jgi:hypothetical protein